MINKLRNKLKELGYKKINKKYYDNYYIKEGGRLSSLHINKCIILVSINNYDDPQDSYYAVCGNLDTTESTTIPTSFFQAIIKELLLVEDDVEVLQEIVKSLRKRGE